MTRTMIHRAGLLRSAALLLLAESGRVHREASEEEARREDLGDDVDAYPGLRCAPGGAPTVYVVDRRGSDEAAEFQGLPPELYLWRAPPPEVAITPELLAGVKTRLAARPELALWQLEPVVPVPVVRVDAPRRRGRCPFPPAEQWRGQRRTWGAR